MAKTQTSAREQAIKDREAAAEAVAHWLSDKAQAELALAEALEQSGRLISDDPAQVDKLGQSIDPQQRRIGMADRAIAEGSKRYLAAARSALLAEADELEPEITKARAGLEEFENRTDELRVALEEFSGRQWRVDDHRDPRDLGPLVTAPAPKDASLRYALATLIDKQARLRSQAENVTPLIVADADLARASVRLFEVSGDLSDASRANIEAVAAALRGEADALEQQRGHLVFDLREAFLEYHRGQVAPGNLDEFVVRAWVPDITRVLMAEYTRELRANVPGHLQQNGVTVRPDPARVAEIEAHAAEIAQTITDMQSEARRLSEQQAALRSEAELLAAAIAPRRELVSA
jgi:hypothetical protein